MKIPIIKTKLIVPAVKDDFLRRAKLTKKLKKIEEYPLTLIHSGAGYGKSTALSLFLTDEKQVGCWYSISSMDDDILPFLTYLTYAIRGIHSNFGTELLTFINQLDRYIREEEINLLCSLFINELLTIQEDVTVILDDFHQIEHSYTVNRWMETFLEHIPSHIHFVISSRSRPVWKQLTKMKVMGHLLEITKEDLILSIEEMELLLIDNYGIELPVSDLERIYKLTEGWVIALCMIAQQGPFHDRFMEIDEHSSHNDLFQYLAMEVFSKQPLIIQQFLEQTCVLEELTEEICNEIVGIAGASALLDQLIERNLFIQKIGDKQYRFHALFKEFLEMQLKDKQPGLFSTLHEKSARVFERRGMWEAALSHYKKINQFSAIASILQEKGKEMLETGKLESLLEHLAKIPDRDKSRYEYLWYLQGEVHRYRSKYSEAEACYQKAYSLYENKKNLVGMSRVLEGRAKIYLDTIQPHRAERLLYEAIQLRETSTVQSSEETGKLYHLLAENLLNSGKTVKSEKWLNRAKTHQVSLLDSNLEARIYLRTGRFDEAKNTLMQKKESYHVKNATVLPQSHRETDLLLSLIASFTGNGTEAKDLAQSGIQLGIKMKAPFVEACGWIRMGHAVQILDKYDLQISKECYETALEMMDQIQVARGKAEPLMGLCALYGANGEYERAMEAGRKALDETESVKDYWLSSLIILSTGIACIYNERLIEALQYLEKAERQFQECRDIYGEMLCHFWKSYVFFRNKELGSFQEEINSFLKNIQMNGFEFFLHKRTTFGPRDLQMFIPLLLQCDKENIERSFILKLLQDMGMKALESHPGYSLRIQTLGPFRIWLGEKEIGERDWQREKAKELFQLFITNPEQFIAKEEITQILWPNQDKQSAERDFKVAMNALNNVLEPSRKARSTPFFIIREGSTYGLNPLASIELDTNQFQEWIQTGLKEMDVEKTLPLLEKAISLYKGEYLSERRYEDWCINKRERMLVFFLRGAEKMAQIYVRKENYDSAIFWCERILERDRTWEEAYRLLMYCFYRKNNRPQAIKWYEKCIEILEEELGVSPLEPTRHMYEMIIESSKFHEEIIY
ncbi:BTAD domain-containing putative transcriptional regulator [Neobacillus sp. D3-1R]|uniref:BTAD domain-containing putative transcriptional regulator n=1 Tax=Neobacillus sp. D3-1R TaxID=3445778 RepID=UPI003FA15087